jgi:hypothetical protein
MTEINTNRVTPRGRKVRIKIINKEHEKSVPPKLITYTYFAGSMFVKFRHIRRAECYSDGGTLT